MDKELGTALPDFKFQVYWGDDGVPVVHVETEGMEEDCQGPICRVYLNDGILFENPPFPELNVVTKQIQDVFWVLKNHTVLWIEHGGTNYRPFIHWNDQYNRVILYPESDPPLYDTKYAGNYLALKPWDEVNVAYQV